MNWWDDPTNVNRLARHLVKAKCYDIDEILRYYEKPWKWSDDWQALISGSQTLDECRVNPAEASRG